MQIGFFAEKRQQYVDEYFAKEVIRHEPDKIEKNPGLRALAKMMLNSFWGKFKNRIYKQLVCAGAKLSILCNMKKYFIPSFIGKFAQRPNMAKVKLISDASEYFDMLTSDEIEVTDVSFVSDDVIEVQFENTENFIDTNSKTNVVIADLRRHMLARNYTVC